MGTTGSHPDIYHQSDDSDSCQKMHYARRGGPKKYSLPAHLSYYPSARQKFFPPPILHTKFHQLNGNLLNFDPETADLEKILKQNSVPVVDGNGGRRRVLFRKSTVDDSAFRKISEIPTRSEKKLSFSPDSKSSLAGKSLSPDSARRKITVKVSSASSASSGVGSVSGEDSEADVETIRETQPQQDKEISPELGVVAPELIEESPAKLFASGSHNPRRSQDSGTSFDEDEAKSLAAVGDFETVFEENESTDGALSVGESQKAESRKKRFPHPKKSSRKYSFAKSFQKMRKRALSLPSTYVENLLKKSKLLF